MVIFHSYVSLPEGRLCLFFFIFSGRIHTLPLEIKPTQQGTWETISIYLTWTTLAVMNQLWQWKILENPFVYSRSLIFFHWNFHGKWNSTCHVWIPEGKLIQQNLPRPQLASGRDLLAETLWWRHTGAGWLEYADFDVFLARYAARLVAFYHNKLFQFQIHHDNDIEWWIHHDNDIE